MNCANSPGSGRVTVSFLSSVAQRGTGPETVSSTFMPRSRASVSSGSYKLQS